MRLVDVDFTLKHETAQPSGSKQEAGGRGGMQTFSAI